MMTLESAIKHCEEVAEEQEKLCKVNDSFNFSQPKWKECANEHRQLAEWLKDYKRLKKQESVLDKIKAEINNLTVYYTTKDKGINLISQKAVNRIFDKYKVGGENERNN